MSASTAKVSLVTGASRGIGRATAVRLAAEGGRIALGGRDENALQETAERVRQAGGEPLPLVLDVTSADSVKEGVARVVAEWGGIDHLINNAGITRDALLMRARPADWEAVIDTNLGGVYRVSREVVPRMLKARTGRIVSLTSVIGEEELASIKRRVAASASAEMSGVSGHARRCAATATGAARWHQPAEFELEILTVDPGIVNAVLEAFGDFSALQNTAAGSLPISELTR